MMAIFRVSLVNGSSMFDKDNPRQWLEAMFHAIDTQDWEALPQFFHPDIVYERPGYDDIAGMEAFLTFYRDIRIIGAGKHVLTAAVADANHAICKGQFSGRSKQGDALSERFADAYEIQDGQIIKRTTYFFRAAI